MKKSILEIYALAVCLFALACFVVSFGIAAYSAVSVANPAFTLRADEYSRLQTNDEFWTACSPGKPCEADAKKPERPSETVLTRQREEAYGRALNIEQRDGLQTLVKCLIVMLIDCVVFGLHWVAARRARTSSD